MSNQPNWQCMSSTELYAAAKSGNSPERMVQVGNVWATGTRQMFGVNDDLTRMIEQSGAWSGPAADSARAALQPLAEWSAVGSRFATELSSAALRAAEAADEVRKLPPPQEFHLGQSIRTTLSGAPLAMSSDVKALRDAAEAVKGEQLRYLAAYTSAMNAIRDSMPTFQQPSRISPDAARVSTPAQSGPPVDYPESAGHTGSGRSEARTTKPSSSSSSAQGTRPGTTSPMTSPGSAQGDQRVQGSFEDNAARRRQDAPLSGEPAGGPTRGPVVGGPRANSAPQGLRPAGADPARSGMGGMGGMGGMYPGGGRAREGEDTIHERPAYLVEDDPEGLFGLRQLVVPPVLGVD